LAPDWTSRPSGSSFNWVYLHQGGRYDAISGLYNFRNRDYSPTLGRWLQVDQIGYTESENNLYREVGNNPIALLDPFGQDKHHWIPKDWKDQFDQLCGNFKLSINDFTTLIKGDMSTGTRHDWLHRVKDYNRIFKEQVLDKSIDCCDLLKNTRRLMNDLWAEMAKRFKHKTIPDFVLEKYRTKTITTEFLDFALKATCKPACRHKDKQKQIKQNPNGTSLWVDWLSGQPISNQVVDIGVGIGLGIAIGAGVVIVAPIIAGGGSAGAGTAIIGGGGAIAAGIGVPIIMNPTPGPR
jgi:RHS repeat-associated protein